MAAGVMATTAPWASASVLERITVMRPELSSQRCTSPQVRDEASERRNPASDDTATRATSNFPLSAVRSAAPSRRRGRAYRGWGEGAGLVLGPPAGYIFSPSFILPPRADAFSVAAVMAAVYSGRIIIATSLAAAS